MGREVRWIRRALRAVLLVAPLAACSGPGEFLLRPESPLTWPPDPAPSRIGYEFAYHDHRDVDRDPGFFSGLLEFVAGAEAVELVHPHGLALATEDVLWIADPGGAVVHRLSLISGDHEVFSGSSEEPLQTPIGVAVVPDGRVFVTDSTAGRVTILAADGDFIESFGEPAELGRPTGIAWDPIRERLLIADTIGHRILSYDLDGTQTSTAGGRGAEVGRFNFPTDLAVGPDGSIAVVDSMNFRVQILAPDLSSISSFGVAGRGPGTFASPKAVAFDSDGHLYVVDAMFDNVQIFDPDGQLLLAFGEQGAALGQLYLPSGIYIDAADRIFVADSGNARLQVFRYLGKRP